MENKDYYNILGVARQASPDAIKSAYRRLARKYHPDVSQEPGAEARFKEVAEAYDSLRDPQRRAAYDRLLETHRAQERKPQPPPEQPAAHDNLSFSDFLQGLFGGRRGGGSATATPRERRRRAPGADQHLTLTISLEEAYRGADKEITVQTPTTKPNSQRSAEPRTLRVRIPAGVQPGQQIRLAGQGGPGLGGGRRGDLYLKLELAPHRLFRLEQKDIHLDLPIAPWEAALGTAVQVPTLRGPVELRIPAGSQSGRKLRLKGRGLPGEPPGDQYVILKIVTPAASTEAARAFYERMAQELPMNPRANLGV